MNREPDRTQAPSVHRGGAGADAARRVKAAALDAGFEAVGICDLHPVERGALERWLAAGYAGEMHYMTRQASRRSVPERIVPGARRAVVVLKNYYHGPPSGRPSARVAQYAWSADYHRLLRERLRPVVEVLLALGATPRCTRVYVDAGPVPERELAARAGLGWVAKNTMLLHPRLGSYTFIGTVFTDLDLPTDPPFVTDHCGRCRRCLDACPTQAFVEPRVLDARQCISYLTIERRSPLTADEGARIGEWLFGCDICQEVCPWNRKFARPTADPGLAPRPELAAPSLEAFDGLDQTAFRARYADTALARAGLEAVRRNAAHVRRNLRARAGRGSVGRD